MRILTERQEVDLGNALGDAITFCAEQATGGTPGSGEVWRSRARTYRELAQLIATAHAVAISEPEPEPTPGRWYLCQLCGQRITDGRPCGCGAR